MTNIEIEQAHALIALNNKTRDQREPDWEQRRYEIANAHSPYCPRVDQLPHGLIREAVARFKQFYLKGTACREPVNVDYRADSLFLTLDFRGVHYGQYYAHNGAELVPNTIHYPD